MKICILTQPLNFNYGGILQAYALQKVLRDMGHDVVTDRFGAPNRLSFVDRIARFGFHFWKRYVCGYKLYNPFQFLSKRLNNSDKSATIYSDVERFIDNNIHCIDLFGGNLLPSAQVAAEYDVFVVGSDQVWRGAYNFLPPYFLSFVPDSSTKRIAYAASFGIDNIDGYSNSLRPKCKEWLSAFNAISVREESGVEICSREFGIDSEMVLDPTMLLDVDDYLSLTENQNHGEYLMSYMLNEDYQRNEIVDYTAEKLSIEALYIIPKGVFNRDTKTLNNKELPSINEWLTKFREAKFVVTDSFHGVVFSIIFNKPFIAVDNSGRGSARFTSLLKIFGLEDRLISKASQINDILFEPIDWLEINDIRDTWREKSLQFLRSNL